MEEFEFGDEQFGPWQDSDAFEIDQLRKQVTRLQADNTRLVEERRSVDIRYNVEHFHRLFGITVANVPHVPTEKNVRLRVRLLAEEFVEFLCAIFGNYSSDVAKVESDIQELLNNGEDLNVDIVEVADALADIDYINAGTALVFGIDMRPIATTVHKSNMAKLGGGIRNDGKIVKPADWVAPDILGELRKQGWVR